MRQKEPERELIALQIAEYLTRKEITVVPSGMSKHAQLVAMRDGELELISFTDLAKRWELTAKQLTQLLFRYTLLVYVMKRDTKMFWLEDIKRIEELPDYKLCKHAT
jgi:hypothetical protein